MTSRSDSGAAIISAPVTRWKRTKRGKRLLRKMVMAWERAQGCAWHGGELSKLDFVIFRDFWGYDLRDDVDEINASLKP